MSQSERISHQFLPMQECYQFLAELLDDPPNFTNITEGYTGRVISRLAFGDVRHTDPIARNSHALLNAISPAAHLTNIIPQLSRLPEWISPWKREERVRHQRERDFFLRTFNTVEKEANTGPSTISFVRTFLETRKEERIDDEEGAYIVGMLGLAGLLTTASALMTYLLVMCLHPEWQAQLQEEIDRVCGDRMPETTDAPQLPILRAVIKEIIRWRPVTPGSKNPGTISMEAKISKLNAPPDRYSPRSRTRRYLRRLLHPQRKLHSP